MRVAPIVLGIMSVVLASCITINVGGKRERPLRERVIGGEGPNRVLILSVEGVLVSEEEEGFFGVGGRENPLAAMRERLRKAAGDSDIKAVVLRINSPGGSVTTSDILYQEVRRFREETGRPVVASLLDVAASGGYYVASAADRIIAHPTSLTGSIGVLMVLFNVEGLFDKLGLALNVIKAGRLKDIGNPDRPLTEEETAILTEVATRFHQNFIEVVDRGRSGLDRTEVEQLADGRPYTADQALEKGLVDRLGYLEDAIQLAKELAGIERAKVVIYEREGEFRPTFYSGPPWGGTRLSLLDVQMGRMGLPGSPRFYYLWTR